MSKDTKLANKTLSLSVELLGAAHKVAHDWNKHRDPLDKRASWADVARHGLELACAENKKKSGNTDPRQLELPTGATKKKATKKKAPPKAKKKATKKKATKKKAAKK